MYLSLVYKVIKPTNLFFFPHPHIFQLDFLFHWKITLSPILCVRVGCYEEKGDRKGIERKIQWGIRKGMEGGKKNWKDKERQRMEGTRKKKGREEKIDKWRI